MSQFAHNRRSQGFSLAEVLLAVLFVSIAFFAFAALQQRLIYSSWKTEMRNAPRESSRAGLVQLQTSIHNGATPVLDNVQDVNPGLYEVRSQMTWTDTSAARTGGSNEKTYVLETYAIHKRVAGWKQD